MLKIVSTIVAIGGGELKALETLPIDREIVRLAKKKHPEALFIPTASNDAIGYWDTFRDVYGKRLGCLTDALFLIKEKPPRKDIERKIMSADIIYVGGGNTLSMLRIWKKNGVDVILRKAYAKGVILSGLSAGAICWFKYGLSDSRRFMKGGKESNSLMRVSALGLLPFLISPHHVREKDSRESGIKKIMMKTPGVALAIDDNSAILIHNNRYKVLKSKKGSGIIKVFRKGNEVICSRIKLAGSLEELHDRNKLAR